MNARTWIGSLLVLLVVAWPVTDLRSDDESGEAVTVKGEVLDLACYIGHEAHGEEHAKCAQSCVKSGQPMGLLAADGTVYLLFASHQDATPYEEAKNHAGKQVEIQGKLANRAGMKGIEVGGVKAM